MNINHHNYEAWFILYLDNELPAAERLEVESFLQQHPSLAAEFDLLQQSRLQPDDHIRFAGIASLYKQVSSTISIDHYQEYFTASLDGELSMTEEKDLQVFLAEHPALHAEWDAFQQTKLEPELSLAFPDKTSLYRYEEENKVVSIGWWKISIAAAVLISFAAGSLYFFPSASTPAGFASAPSSQPAVTEKNISAKDQEPQDPATLATVPAEQSHTTAARHENRADNASTSSPLAKVTDRPAQVQPLAVADNQALRQQTLDAPVDLPVKSIAVAVHKPITQTVLPQQNINSPAVTSEGGIAYQIKAPDQTFDTYVAAEEPNNKKIRGFFRKATRILERTTNISAANDDDKLLVGAFAINLK